MDNAKVIEKLKRIKQRMQNAAQICRRKLKTGALIASVGAATSVAPVSRAAQPLSGEDASKATTTSMVYSPKALSSLTPDNVRTVRTMVNVSPNKSYNFYEFYNKAVDARGKEIKDFDDATKYSIWDVSYKREVGTHDNPVGVFNEYAGSLQFSMFNAQNVAIYALLHRNYRNIAHNFFNTSSRKNEFAAALKDFWSEYKEKGNLAYHTGNAKRKRLASFIYPDFKKRFAQEGLRNPHQFLNLQREYASDCYTSFDQINFDKIVTTLKQQNIEIDDVSWAIVGMWCAKHIATGNFSGLAATVKGKTLEQINSPAYIQTLSQRFPSVFNDPGGKKAKTFALEHLNEGHSLTTIKELSQIAKRPDLYDNYLWLLPRFPKKTYSKAKYLDNAHKRVFKEAYYKNRNRASSR